MTDVTSNETSVSACLKKWANAIREQGEADVRGGVRVYDGNSYVEILDPTLQEIQFNADGSIDITFKFDWDNVKDVRSVE